MKNIQLIHLTPEAHFLILEGTQYRESTFEGLNFNNSLPTRFIIRPYLYKQIQCTISKTTNKIRYHNMDFYQQMLQLQCATLNHLQFQQSKLFTSDEKQQLKNSAKQINRQLLNQIRKKIRDCTSNRNLLIQLYSSNKNIKANIQYLSEEIILCYQSDNLTQYIPIKLQHIDHYFQLIQKIKFSKFYHQHRLIAIHLTTCFYNLNKHQHELQAILPQNLQKAILIEGWGTISTKNLISIPPSLYIQLTKIQQLAKNSHKGIYAKPFEILSLVYSKTSIPAIVQQIIEGYIYKIRCKDNKIIIIQLNKIYSPIGNQPGAFLCRQFARKNLIDRQIHVFFQDHLNIGEYMFGSIVRISDNKNIDTFMLENGYAFVKESVQGMMFYDKLQTLYKKAKDTKKGIFNDKSTNIQFYEDFTVAPNKKLKLQKNQISQAKQLFLQQLKNDQQAVIQKIIDAINYIVRIDTHKKIIKVKLDGVCKLVSNPRLPQMKLLQKQSEQFCYRKFFQRTVNLQLTEYQENTNSFIGIIRLVNKGRNSLSLQQILLTHGLVILSNQYILQQKWLKCEKQAQNQQLNCWTPKLKPLIHSNIFQLQPQQFLGKFSWIENGQLAYIQPNSTSQQLDFIDNKLNTQNMKNIHPDDLVPGYLCAAPYFSQFCRAKIVSINEKNVLVKFVDWGNKQTVVLSSLRQLPNDLQYIPPLCCKVTLDLVRPLKTTNIDHLQKLREYVMQSECKFCKSHGNTINAYKNGQHLNASLIHEGYLKVDLSKIVDEGERKRMEEEMNWLRKELVGVWELEDNYQDLVDSTEQFE